jgi:type VI secretion system protein ImpC
MPGMNDFEFSFTKPQHHRVAARSEQTPRRILVLGNFSGQEYEEGVAKPISQRTIHALDIDTFAAVLGRIRPQIHLGAVGGSGAIPEVAISEIDDFHPDSLYRNLEIFRSLREMRRRLLDPATFAAAAAELMPNFTKASTGDDTGSVGGGFSAFIRDLVAPHIIPDADPRQEVYVELLDEAIRTQMSAVLHAPSFQAVESAWRGLDWLLTELEFGEELQLFVCDVTKEELLADLRGAAGQLEESEFYQLVVEKEIGTLGGREWAFFLGNYDFGHSADDVFLLAALGAIAEQAEAPFLAGAKAEVLGCRCLAECPDSSAWSVVDPADKARWASLRNSSHASWLNLALPRILMRLPYGSQTDAIESFAFEELTGDPDHESFLWGNPAFACSMLLARSFLDENGATRSGSLTLEGLPAFVYLVDDAKTMKPCAEVLLSERTGQEILKQGLIPLLSHRGHNGVSLLRFQSLAEF